MVGKVRELNRNNFAVKQHLKYVELYSNPDNYNALTYEDTLLIGQELAPLIEPDDDDATALRFDALNSCRSILTAVAYVDSGTGAGLMAIVRSVLDEKIKLSEDEYWDICNKLKKEILKRTNE